MIDLDKTICTGCSACAIACPKGAIRMEFQEGFQYPVIDADLCVKCSLCIHICENRKKTRNTNEHVAVLGVKACDDAVRKESQSGGAFWIFAQNVITGGGVVYGVRLDERFVALHDRAETLDELSVFRGSKYVQSDLGNTFMRVKEDLKANRTVLFSGTPCQVAGLRSYLGKDYANLITIDLICHGVPSPLIWQDYLEYQKQKHGGKQPEQVEFRDKRLPWGKHREKLVFDGVICESEIYASLFHSRLIIRKECFRCEFANLNRVSDITIGDFWGIEDVNISFKDDQGISSVLVNTEKGRELFEKTRHLFHHFQCDVADVANKNQNLCRPSNYPKNREQFWKDYKRGIQYVIGKYSSEAWSYKIKKGIYKVLKRMKIKN